MGLDATGHYVPASTDAPARSAFDKFSRSLRDPVPVADTAARTALLVTLAAASPSVVPSTSSPIFVFRADAGAGRELEYTIDGTTWLTIDARDTGWIALPFETGFEAHTVTITCQYRMIANRVFLAGLVKRTAGDFAALGNYTVSTLPSGYRPPQNAFFTGGATNGKSTPTLVVDTDGLLYVRPTANAISYAALDSVSWFID